MDDLDWNLIKGFLAVAEAGSLSAAARATGAAQPTLGRHVEELERRLGVTLFQRQPRGMALTPEGAALTDHARRIAADAAAFRLTAEGRSHAIAGTVRITASQVVAHFLLPPIVAKLAATEPELQIEIDASNSVQNLLTRDADIAIRMTAPQQGDLVARKIAEVAMGLYAAPAYLERHGAPETMEDLLSHRIVGYDRDTQMIRGFAAMGYPATRDFFPFRTDDHVLNWRLVEAGAGLGFMQRYAAALSNRVAPVLPDLPIPRLPMYLAAHRELRTSARIRRAYDFLAEELERLPLSGGPFRP